VQALVRPLAGHDALPALTAMIESADAFQRLLASLPPESFRLAWVEAATPQVWWDVLEQYPRLAVWVAANRTVPDAVVAHLAAHDSIDVRAAVASGPGMSQDVMLRLAHDKDSLVRLRVACNARTLPQVLELLASDACPVVSKHAQARLEHDLSGETLPASYLDGVSLLDLLH
jgi:hypothetical protein